MLKQWKRSGSEKPGRTIKRARYGGIAIKAIPPFFKENLGYDPNTHRSGPNLRQIEAQYARENTLSVIRKEWGGTAQCCPKSQ